MRQPAVARAWNYGRFLDALLVGSSARCSTRSVFERGAAPLPSRQHSYGRFLDALLVGSMLAAFRVRKWRGRSWPVDPFSSAMSFDGWRDFDVRTIEWPRTYEPLPVREPRTWLLRVGWRKHGLIDPREVPGKRAHKRDAFVFAE